MVDNRNVELFASGQRTATVAATKIRNKTGKYGRVVIDITSLNGDTPSITVTLKAIDPTSGKKTTVLASAALGAVATTVLKVGPTYTAAANAVAQDVMPPLIEVEVVHADAKPINYSVAMDLVN